MAGNCQNPGETEFHQAVRKLLIAYAFHRKKPKVQTAQSLERMVEPERVIIFRVPWLDNGEIGLIVASVFK